MLTGCTASSVDRGLGREREARQRRHDAGHALPAWAAEARLAEAHGGGLRGLAEKDLHALLAIGQLLLAAIDGLADEEARRPLMLRRQGPDSVQQAAVGMRRGIAAFRQAAQSRSERCARIKIKGVEFRDEPLKRHEEQHSL